MPPDEIWNGVFMRARAHTRGVVSSVCDAMLMFGGVCPLPVVVDVRPVNICELLYTCLID